MPHHASRARHPELDPRSVEFDAAFDQVFVPMAFAMNRHFVDHMLRAMRELELDFESMVIWGLLAHLNLAQILPRGVDPNALDDLGYLLGSKDHIKPLRLRDLEQVARMPRETIRRKLHGLEKLGHVVRQGSGWVLRTGEVDPVLREFNRESAKRLLALSEEMGSLLKFGYKEVKKRRKRASDSAMASD